MLLEEVLSDDEFTNVSSKRCRAILAPLAWKVSELHEVDVYERMGLNFATYGRARRLWRDRTPEAIPRLLARLTPRNAEVGALMNGAAKWRAEQKLRRSSVSGR